MKKTITLFILFISVLTYAQKKEKVKGSKIVKLEQKQVDNFESVEVEDNLEIFLVKGDECALEIEADDNLIEFVEYKLTGKNLRISTSRDISSYKKLSVRVTYNDKMNMVIAKDETNVTALSDVVLDDITFKSYDYAKLFLNAKTKNFTLMANDKSKIELNLKSDKTAIDLSKSAYVKALISSPDMRFDVYQKASADVEGDVINLKLRLDNSSDFNGKKLTAKNATVELAAYSKLSINISNLATIDASGNSEMDLYGEPKIEIKRFTESAMIKKRPIKN
ncbi:GIN domain-containing protein [Flavobacterium sp. 25HG05S-40]|uniref:GIN domain-containing protein n=1 Tax=Flavobacterium sp. 25HG05S-40 TaxID=3458682 RepID=UPI004043C5C7